MASNWSRQPDSGRSPHWDGDSTADRIGQVLSRVQLPLSNAEFALEQFLLCHGPRLDTETRMLLAGVRDCIGRAAGSARCLTRDDGSEAGKVGRAA